jgi:hypothetical protein
LAAAQHIDKGSAVQGERHSAAKIGVVEWRRVAINDQSAADAPRPQLANRLRILAFDILQQRNSHLVREGHVYLSREKREQRR